MPRPINVFRPIDQGTVSLAATSSTGRVALTQGASQYKFSNTGTEAVFVRFGDVTINATLPNGATGGSMPILAGAIETITPPVTAPTHIAGITASGNVTLYVTAGEGM